jgi:hypothetical protein
VRECAGEEFCHVCAYEVERELREGHGYLLGWYFIVFLRRAKRNYKYSQLEAKLFSSRTIRIKVPLQANSSMHQ